MANGRGDPLFTHSGDNVLYFQVRKTVQSSVRVRSRSLSQTEPRTWGLRGSRMDGRVGSGTSRLVCAAGSILNRVNTRHLQETVIETAWAGAPGWLSLT